MKNLSSRMKILLVLAVCVGLMVPVTASAFWDGNNNGTILEKEFKPGKHKEKLMLGWRNTYPLEFRVENGVGDGSGKNVVSSVKIALLDNNGEVQEVIISPDKFNQQEFSNEVNTLAYKAIENKQMIDISVRVSGPKDSYIKLVVKKLKDGPSWIR